MKIRQQMKLFIWIYCKQFTWYIVCELSRLTYLKQTIIKKRRSSTWYILHTYFAHNTELWPPVQTARSSQPPIIKFRSRQIFFRLQFQFRVSFFSPSRFVIFWFILCYVCNVQQWARYENTEREAPNGDEIQESDFPTTYYPYQQHQQWMKRRTRRTEKPKKKKR